MKTVIAFLLFSGLHMAAQDMQSCPMHKEHMKEPSQHQADVEKHGDEAMGFPHDETAHHFRLYSDGGAIEVTANDTKDSRNMQAIRSHLTHIVTMFSSGEFSIPMFVHDQVPPGVPVMKEKRTEIFYTFEGYQQVAQCELKQRIQTRSKQFITFFVSRLTTTILGILLRSRRGNLHPGPESLEASAPKQSGRHDPLETKLYGRWRRFLYKFRNALISLASPTGFQPGEKR